MSNYVFKKNDIVLESEVKEITDSFLFLKTKKDNHLMNISIDLATLEIVDQEDNTVLNFDENEDISLYFYNILKTEIKNSDFDRWRKGKLVFRTENKESNIVFSKKKNLSLYLDFIKNNDLFDSIEKENELFYLKNELANDLSLSLLKGRSRFSSLNLLVKNYHFQNKVKIMKKKSSLSLLIDNEEIDQFTLDIKSEKEEAWLVNEESPYFSEEYLGYKLNKEIELNSEEIESTFQESFVNFIEKSYPLKELSLSELTDFEEIKSEGNKSLRLEDPLYKYYIKEEKILIEKFNFKSEEWEVLS